MKLKIGISPCPNDTFIFDALHSGEVFDPEFDFEFILEDVETLNQLALAGELDIVKISYAHYFSVEQEYTLLRAGGALGHGVGPLLVSKQEIPLNQIPSCRIAIPGIHTTAHFLFQYFFPTATNKVVSVFSDIEENILAQDVDAGVVIHESRFTYQDKGLVALMDLGEAWQNETGLPIPLGGIAIKRNLSAIHTNINQLVLNSIQQAWKRYPLLHGFVQDHAQEMSEEVMRKHIELYVNDYSLDIGDDGMKSVQHMKEILSPQSTLPIFVK